MAMNETRAEQGGQGNYSAGAAERAVDQALGEEDFDFEARDRERIEKEEAKRRQDAEDEQQRILAAQLAEDILADTGLDAGGYGDQPMPMPQALVTPPGILAEMVEMHLTAGFRQDRELALHASIMHLAHFACGSFEIGTDNRWIFPNLYALQVAVTGAGKETAYSLLDSYHHEAEAMTAPGLRLLRQLGASAPNVHRHMGPTEQRPVALPAGTWIYDECGPLIKAGFPSRAGGSSATPELIGYLLKAYGKNRPGAYLSASDSNASMSSKAFTDPIKEPCFNLLMSSQPDVIESVLSDQFVTGGFFGRLLICQTTEKGKRVAGKAPDSGARRALVRKLADLARLENGRRKTVYLFDEDLSWYHLEFMDAADAFEDRIKDHCRGLRTIEMATRVGGLFAIARGDTRLTRQDLMMALELYSYWITTFLAYHGRMSGWGKEGHGIRDAVLKKLRAAGSNGVHRSTLFRDCPRLNRVDDQRKLGIMAALEKAADVRCDGRRYFMAVL